MKGYAESAALRVVRPLELMIEATDHEIEEVHVDQIPLTRRVDKIRIALREDVPLPEALQQQLQEELQEKLVRLAILEGDLQSLGRRRRHLENVMLRLFYEQEGTGDPVRYRSPAERAERTKAAEGTEE